MTNNTEVVIAVRVALLKARASKVYVKITELCKGGVLSQKGTNTLKDQLNGILIELKGLDPKFPKEYLLEVKEG